LDPQSAGADRSAAAPQVTRALERLQTQMVTAVFVRNLKSAIWNLQFASG